MAFYIKKASGESEPFDLEKFKISLLKAGASESLVNKIVKAVPRLQPKSTREIHDFASAMLLEANRPVSYRYNIKRAVMELGPSGFPFELFIATIFNAKGFQTTTGKTVTGYCIEHEVDVLARKENHHYLIECKFHNRQNLTTTIQTALYVKARFDDVRQAWDEREHLEDEFHLAWLITNTRFSSEAIKYAQCRNIQMLSWSYPEKDNLMTLIEKFHLHPITVLTTLSRSQKRSLIKHGLLLCKKAAQHTQLFKNLGFSEEEIEKIIEETDAVCQFNKKP